MDQGLNPIRATIYDHTIAEHTSQTYIIHDYIYIYILLDP
jgi:hypothetical protein